jgi:L-ascorbate metabolism protein UlaG (beta-lactamase superfamily)
MDQKYTSKLHSIVTILRWQISRKFQKRPRFFSSLRVHKRETFPKENCLVWHGHATVSLQFDQQHIIIDPVLNNIPFYKRFTALPLETQHIIPNIIVLTHAHYDHFDKSSVYALVRNNPNLIIIAPKGFWRYLKKIIKKEQFVELDLWETTHIGQTSLTLVPSLHWSKRTPFDTNKALWGGYVIQNGEHCVYHSGDTAYGEHFREIGEKFDIDEAFLPIGAYAPSKIMKVNHTNPAEALDAATDLGAKIMIPIHYGTFALSDEPLDEPLQWFNRLSHTNDYPFIPKVLEIGEIYFLSVKSTVKST